MAPREGVSLGQRGAADGGRHGESSSVIVPSADEGAGGASVGVAAAGGEETFFGGSADSSGTQVSGGKRSTFFQVWGSPRRVHTNKLVADVPQQAC